MFEQFSFWSNYDKETEKQIGCDTPLLVRKPPGFQKQHKRAITKKKKRKVYEKKQNEKNLTKNHSLLLLTFPILVRGRRLRGQENGSCQKCSIAIIKKMSIAGISSSNGRILSGPLVTNRIHGVGWYSCSRVSRAGKM